MVNHDLEVRLRKNWDRIIEAVGAAILQFKDAAVNNLLDQLISLSLKPCEEMTDHLISAETLSFSLNVAGSFFVRKLVSVVLKGLPDNHEYLWDSSLTFQSPTSFFDLKKAPKDFYANWQNLKACINSSKAMSDEALLVLQYNAKTFIAAGVLAATKAGIRTFPVE